MANTREDPDFRHERSGEPIGIADDLQILPAPTPTVSLDAVIGTSSRPAGFSESSHDSLR